MQTPPTVGTAAPACPSPTDVEVPALMADVFLVTPKWPSRSNGILGQWFPATCLRELGTYSLRRGVISQLRPDHGCLVPVCRKMLSFLNLKFFSSKISLNLS